MSKVLMALHSDEKVSELKSYFEEHELKVSCFTNGKDAQVHAAKERYLAIIIDLEVKNNSALETIRFLKTQKTEQRIILLCYNEDFFKELELSEADIKKIGISCFLLNPLPADILQKVEGASVLSEWKKLQSKPGQVSQEEEQSADDVEFTKVSIEEFFSGNTAIFDLYVKISDNKYIKILSRGDFFERDRIKKYRDEKKVDYLYFKKDDRGSYINFMNDLIQKTTRSVNTSLETKVTMTKNTVTKYIEETYLEGIKPAILDEGARICDNVINVLQQDTSLWKLLRDFTLYDKTIEEHIFMVTLYSSVTCSHLAWSGPSTVDKIAMGAMLHDIGKVKLPSDLQTKKHSEMSPEELKQYRNHSVFGVEVLNEFPSIPSQVKQIVEQHHEWNNGEGYPNKLSGIKIFPLAKVVALANDISNYLVEKQIPPLEGVRHFIQDRRIYTRYDADVLRAFVKGFANPDKLGEIKE